MSVIKHLYTLYNTNTTQIKTVNIVVRCLYYWRRRRRWTKEWRLSVNQNWRCLAFGELCSQCPTIQLNGTATTRLKGWLLFTDLFSTRRWLHSCTSFLDYVEYVTDAICYHFPQWISERCKLGLSFVLFLPVEAFHDIKRPHLPHSAKPRKWPLKCLCIECIHTTADFEVKHSFHVYQRKFLGSNRRSYEAEGGGILYVRYIKAPRACPGIFHGARPKGRNRGRRSRASWSSKLLPTS